MVVLVRRGDVEQAIKTGGKVMIEQGAKRNLGNIKDTDFCFEFDNIQWGFAHAKKCISVAIFKAFPGVFFSQEVSQTQGKIGAEQIPGTTKFRRVEDRFVNYYLVFKKGGVE